MKCGKKANPLLRPTKDPIFEIISGKIRITYLFIALIGSVSAGSDPSSKMANNSENKSFKTPCRLQISRRTDFRPEKVIFKLMENIYFI